MRGVPAQRGFNLLELQVVLFVISILAMLSIPIYRNFTVQAKVGEGLHLISPIKNHIVEYYHLNGRFPNSNLEAGIAPPEDYATRWIERVEIMAQPSGAIRITYDSEAIPALSGGNTLLLSPALTANTRIFNWNCRLGTLADKYRPRSCRINP